jgi:hypothetical protein
MGKSKIKFNKMPLHFIEKAKPIVKQGRKIMGLIDSRVATTVIRFFYFKFLGDIMKKAMLGLLVCFFGCLFFSNVYSADVTISAVIKTVEAGNINGVWQKGGEDTTSRGDRVVWGHFYASPGDVTWGSANNPEVFVKIWYDANGRVDVNFFHVSVPDIEVSATYNGVNLKSTTTTSKRYI